MDAISSVLSLLVFVGLILGAIRLVARWRAQEAEKTAAEAWGYLSWKPEDLARLHEKLIELIAAGDRKPRYFRSISAIAEAIDMRKRLSAETSTGGSTSSGPTIATYTDAQLIAHQERGRFVAQAMVDALNEATREKGP